MGDDAAVQKAISDPKFLAFGPEDQVAILKQLGAQPSAKPATLDATAPAGSLPLPPKAEPPEGIATKLGRGATLGAASGAGIPETETPVTDLAINTGKAIAETPGRMAEEMRTYGLAGVPGAEIAHVAKESASGLWKSGKEIWQGMRDSDPEQFAHGFASTATQILLLSSLRKMGETAPAKVSPGKRLAKTAAAIDAGAEQFADLKTAMPEIVDAAKKSGLESVGDLGETVSKAHGQVEQQFNQALAPVAQTRYMPTEIATRLRNLVTPDMLKDYNMIESAKQAAQRAGLKNPKFKFSDNAWKTHDAVVEIQRQAHEFERPWTIQELNARRMTENENLRNSYYNKDTRGQAAAENKVQTATSQAVADGSRDIVYDQISKANPGLDARALKIKQGALWALDDYINHPKRGVIADLEAQQAQVHGANRLENVRAGVSVGKTLVPHGYLSGLMEALSPHDPMAAANAKVSSVFGAKLTRAAARARLVALSLPVAAITRSKQRPGSLAQPPSASDEE
jgi:hypothetical protein